MVLEVTGIVRPEVDRTNEYQQNYMHNYMYNGFTLEWHDKSQPVDGKVLNALVFTKEKEEWLYEWLRQRHEYRETHEEPKYNSKE